jgi:Mn2+/Fe2+ NRAMP family transporter
MSEQPNQSYYPAKPNSSLAIASLVLGILGWTVIPTIGAIAAIITGHMAKKEIRESVEDLGGDGMATAGLILGYANIVVALCGCLIFAGALALGISIPLLEGGY